MALGIIGFLAFLVCVGMVMLNKARRKPVKYWLIGAPIAFILFIVVYLSASPTTPAPVSIDASIDASAEMQAKRYNFIQDLVAKGIILKFEKPATLPHVWVTPTFYALDFDMKETFISVVWTYYIVQDSKATTVILYDSKTGKQVGVFAKEYGGLKLD